jgi:hypothetical protein
VRKPSSSAHVVSLPERVLDIALTGLVQLGHNWIERHPGPWEVVHDQSSNMSKQKWIWDAYSSTTMPTARFEYPGAVAQFPMNVTQTRFGDSAQETQLQICDVIAGVCSAAVRSDKNDPSHLNYREKLLAAGIETFFIGGLWPSPDITPESLGRKGWDGNIAIEWLPSTCLRKDRRQSLEASRQ